MFFSKFRSWHQLNKARKAYLQAKRHLARKKNSLSEQDSITGRHLLEELRLAISSKDASKAQQCYFQLLEWMHQKARKTFFERIFDFLGAILFALCIAIAIRQVWFELYVIPTGSMRPTLKESDLLLVSKTPFGINLPLQTGHFFFSPEAVQRGTIFVFTGKDMDIPDGDTTYFFLFPGKKQYVKRLMAKPGDTLYFYGGQIYGIDQEGREIRSLLDDSWAGNLEHIPFIRFEGKVETTRLPQNSAFTQSIFYQMNEPVAKMEMGPGGMVRGEVLYPKENPLPHYSDLWGIGNFAMTRLLTASQAKQLFPKEADTSLAPFYLELLHHPSVHRGQILRDDQGRIRPAPLYQTSLLPMQEKDLDALANHLTTCRFHVQNGKGMRIGTPFNDLYSRYFPSLLEIPDGTYEIQNGVASQVYWAGISRTLPPSHPIYQAVRQQIQTFFNLGIEWMTLYSPAQSNPFFPSRYAYFRSGDLYLMGKPILLKEDANLLAFVKREKERGEKSPSYSPFIDQGPPLLPNGSLDRGKIERFGLKIPTNGYLALGDNHAMSSDSRQFGFVPQDNLRGKVSFLFWPIGPRFGSLSQPTYPWFTPANEILWSVAILTLLSYWLYRRRSFSG